MSEDVEKKAPAQDPPPGEVTADVEAVKQIREIFQTMGKAAKALKIYPETNPLRAKFLQETQEKFLVFLADHGDLIVHVKRFELLYEDQVIYSNAGQDDGIALRLYGDGIREVHFCEGLSQKEVSDFIQVVTGGYSADDDDASTLLWEKEFEHIRYFVVEEGGEGGGPAGTLVNEEAGRKTSEGIRMAFAVEARDRVATGKETGAPSMETEVEAIYGKPLVEIFCLSSEEVARLQTEMEEEDAREPIMDLVEMLLQILQVESNLESYSELMGSLEKALRAMVQEGKFSQIVPVIQRLKNFSVAETNFSPDHAARAMKAVDSLGEEEAIKALGYVLNMTKLDAMESLHDYLVLLNPNAILPLSNLLGALEQMKMRRLLCQSLAILARDHIPMLLPRLEDPNWYVVRNIVYILGKIGGEGALASLRKVARHPEVRVRKELIHALGEMAHPSAMEVMADAVDDENSQIRVAALRALVRGNCRKAAERIRVLIEQKDFGKKELYEKKEHFDALGRLLGNETVPFLKNYLLQTSWWGRGHLDEMRLCASLALNRIGTPEAIAVLQEGALSGDKTIRKISQDALKESRGEHVSKS
jgi:HEAT repeat protein